MKVCFNIKHDLKMDSCRFFLSTLKKPLGMGYQDRLSDKIKYVPHLTIPPPWIPLIHGDRNIRIFDFSACLNSSPPQFSQ